MIPKAFNRTRSLINTFERKGIRATQGSLRLEVQLGTSASYTFAVNDNQTKLVTEIRLRSGDAFVPTKVGLFIRKAGSLTPTDAQQAISTLNTFPNTSIFSSTGEANNLESIYSSRLQVTVNSVNLTETIDTLNFRRVDMAQQGLAVSTVATTGIYQRSAWQGGDYGFINYEQDICFNGQANNNVLLNLATAVDNTDQTSPKTSLNYAVLIFRGILLLNGAGVAQDKSIKTFIRR
jgi:hypothetical protein